MYQNNVFYHYLLILLSLTSGIPGFAQEVPDDDVKWTDEWGAEDERGALNRLGAEQLLTAAELIRHGKIYELGRVYEADMPLVGNRSFNLIIPGAPTQGPLGNNNVVFNYEVFFGEIAQIGTQFDGLGHIGVRQNGKDYYYNKFTGSEILSPFGLKKLGVEKTSTFFTRGILIDVAAYKGVERLEPGYIITQQDIEETLRQQNLSIQPGDVVLFHTGHGKLWKKNNQLYNSSEPGPGISAIRWLATQHIVMAGADNWGLEASPGEHEGAMIEGHQWLLTYHGIYIIENLNLEALANDRVYEFAFIYSPLKLKGASGSPGSPIAVY